AAGDVAGPVEQLPDDLGTLRPEVVPDGRLRRDDVRLLAGRRNHVVNTGVLRVVAVLPHHVHADVHQLDRIERARAFPGPGPVRLRSGEAPLHRHVRKVVQPVARAETGADMNVHDGVDTVEKARLDHVAAAREKLLRGTAVHDYRARQIVPV